MTDAFLYAIPEWLLYILIVGGSVGLTWVGTVLLQRCHIASQHNVFSQTASDTRHNGYISGNCREHQDE